ncbi:MAG: HAD-IIIA family hydrolase [Taibaiella sp.]|nr:HAD-IIIA family hydrolase [Taibaiella sp.]
MDNLLELFAPIRTMVFDVDGVLTDGSLFLTEDGHSIRQMNIKDGYAIQLAVKKGYNLIVISGGNSVAVRKRMESLGVMNVHINVDNKKVLLRQLLNTFGIEQKDILYMGDDIPDYEVMKECGLPCCPNDAVAEIRQLSKYISPYDGGRGCVRDVIEKVLKLNGHWDIPA